MDVLTQSSPAADQTDHASKPAWIRTVVIAAILIAVCVLVYAPVLSAHFLSLDDGIHIYRNPFFHPITAQSLLHFWTHAYEGLYIPLSYMLFAGLLSIAKPTGPLSPSDPMLSANPHVFHAASLILHIVNVLLVFVLLTRLVKKPWPAAAGAFLFAIHPLQVEAVAWASELRGLLSNFFSLIAILFAVSYAEIDQTKRWRTVLYCAATLAFAAALLSKPSAVVVPLLILVIHVALQKYPLRKSVLFVLPWCAVSSIFLFLTRSAQSLAPQTLVALWQRPLVACDALVFYVSKLFWPTHLIVDYGRTPQSVVNHWWVYAELLVVVAVVAAAWLKRKSFPIPAAAIALFVIALAPVLGLIPFSFQFDSTVADRYAYMALLGPAVGLAYALAWLGRRRRDAQRATLACSAIFLLLAMQSSVQTEYWQNDFSLYSHSLQTNPRSWLALVGVGMALGKMGEEDEAMRTFKNAERLFPKIGIIHADIGNLEQKENHLSEAVAEHREATLLDPDNALLWCDLGSGEDMIGNYSAAANAYQTAQRLDPSSALIKYSLGSVREHQGNDREAIALYRASIKLRPMFALTHEQLGIALATNGDLKAAVAQWKTALILNPKSMRAATLLMQVKNAPIIDGKVNFHLKLADNTNGTKTKP